MEAEAERFNMAWKAMKAEEWMVVEPRTESFSLILLNDTDQIADLD
jgi:hypothetical protein